MAGRTDAWILSRRRGGPRHPARLPDSRALPRTSTSRHLATRARAAGSAQGRHAGRPRRCSTRCRSRDDVYLALLTGNYEAGARIKLEYFDLWRYFRCGAFGDDAPDRNGLVPKRSRASRACGGPAVAPADAVVIGDTPLDVACAAAGGARSIAVATGSYERRQLRAAGADVVFEDLSDTGGGRAVDFRKVTDRRYTDFRRK